MPKIKYVQQLETWTCAVCSCAMLLGVSKEKILEDLKKTNEKLLLANEYLEELREEGYAPPGIQIDTFIKLAKTYGYAVGSYDTEEFTKEEIKKIISNSQGIFVITKLDQYHAVVWDGGIVLDPADGATTLDRVYEEGIVTYYRFVKLPTARKEKTNSKSKKGINGNKKSRRGSENASSN